MSTISLEKLDKFYLLLFGVIIVSLAFTGITMRSIFFAMQKAHTVLPDNSAKELVINTEKVNSSYQKIFKQ